MIVSYLQLSGQKFQISIVGEIASFSSLLFGVDIAHSYVTNILGEKLQGWICHSSVGEAGRIGRFHTFFVQFRCYSVVGGRSVFVAQHWIDDFPSFLMRHTWCPLPPHLWVYKIWIGDLLAVYSRANVFSESPFPKPSFVCSLVNCTRGVSYVTKAPKCALSDQN